MTNLEITLREQSADISRKINFVKRADIIFRAIENRESYVYRNIYRDANFDLFEYLDRSRSIVEFVCDLNGFLLKSFKESVIDFTIPDNERYSERVSEFESKIKPLENAIKYISRNKDLHGLFLQMENELGM